MRVGVTMAFNDHTAPDFIGAAAQLVEESGFHSVWVPEHVLFFPDYASTYPYSEDGRIPGEPEGLLEEGTHEELLEKDGYYQDLVEAMRIGLEV